MPAEPTSTAEPSKPWGPFLRDLDALLKGPIALHCIGGFVVTQQYRIGRETSDIDFLSMVPYSNDNDVEGLAGRGSPLHRKHRLYMQYVGIATPPSNYETRLTRMFATAPWKNLTLLALEAHDLALAKLERNADRDREDVLSLARAGYLHPDTLKERYFEELRPYLLSNLSWHDKTLELWLEMGWPTKRGS